MRKAVFGVLVLALVGLLVAAGIAYKELAADISAPELGAGQTSDGQTTDDQESQDEEKIEAPDFSAVDDDGDEVKLSDYFGKPIVLNFWASWCPPCKEEMPDFEKAFGEMEDVQFLMVNMTDGSRETEQLARDFIDRSEYTFPVLYDTAQQAAMGYGVRSIPTTYFIDAEGYIITGAQGKISYETLLKGI